MSCTTYESVRKLPYVPSPCGVASLDKTSIVQLGAVGLAGLSEQPVDPFQPPPALATAVEKCPPHWSHPWISGSSSRMIARRRLLLRVHAVLYAQPVVQRAGPLPRGPVPRRQLEHRARSGRVSRAFDARRQDPGLGHEMEGWTSECFHSRDHIGGGQIVKKWTE
jgi:hypothetical protein